MNIGEVAATVAGAVLRAVGAPPLVAASIERIMPSLVDYAAKRIAEGADPADELELMMLGGEEAARAAERAKFGQ